jgi:hypothetical protein
MKDIPAFPIVVDYGDGVKYQTGMTLRDYFAAKAMQGMLSENSGIRYPTDELVDFAYKVADAMISAREKK